VLSPPEITLLIAVALLGSLTGRLTEAPKPKWVLWTAIIPSTIGGCLVFMKGPLQPPTFAMRMVALGILVVAWICIHRTARTRRIKRNMRRRHGNEELC